MSRALPRRFEAGSRTGGPEPFSQGIVRVKSRAPLLFRRWQVAFDQRRRAAMLGVVTDAGPQQRASSSFFEVEMQRKMTEQQGTHRLRQVGDDAGYGSEESLSPAPQDRCAITGPGPRRMFPPGTVGPGPSAGRWLRPPVVPVTARPKQGVSVPGYVRSRQAHQVGANGVMWRNEDIGDDEGDESGIEEELEVQILGKAGRCPERRCREEDARPTKRRRQATSGSDVDEALWDIPRRSSAAAGYVYEAPVNSTKFYDENPFRLSSSSSRLGQTRENASTFFEENPFRQRRADCGRGRVPARANLRESSPLPLPPPSPRKNTAKPMSLGPVPLAYTPAWT